MGRRWVRSLAVGEPDSPPDVVVLPGLGALGYLLPMVRVWGRTATVELLDLPGFGHRRTAGCPAGVRDVAAAAAAWLADAGGRPVTLLGHSTGSQAALVAALEVPDRVASLVLAGATFPPAARRWGPLSRAALRTVVHETPGELRATLPDYLRGRGGVLTLLRSAMADAPERAVGGVAAQVVVIRGRHDHLCPADWAARLADAAPRGELLTVPGAHNFPFTHPQAAVAALARRTGA